MKRLPVTLLASVALFVNAAQAQDDSRPNKAPKARSGFLQPGKWWNLYFDKSNDPLKRSINAVILLPLVLTLVGCGADRVSIEADAADSRHEHTDNSIADEPAAERPSAQSTSSAATESEPVPAATDKVVWEWLDANIGSQERLAASRTGQRLSGPNVGEPIQVSSAQNLLFTEQLNLVYEIRKSKNIAVARQYMLVHTLMTIDQAEHTQSVLPPNDPRRVGVRQQIAAATQLLAAVGYEQHLGAASADRVGR